MNPYLLVGGGLLVLVVGAEALVRGGAALAARMGISPMIVGLTVVSIGTSLPELAVGIDAALNDAGPLAVGNIAGTNMVNLLLIFGLSAAIAPLVLHPQTLRLDLPVMTGSALLLLLLCLNGSLNRVDGAVLVVVTVLYTLAIVRTSRRESAAVTTEFEEAYAPPTGRALRDIGLLIGGLAVVVLGAEWLVDGAVRVATDLGISEAMIGLTIVAIGTSAPELVTTVVSTFRGERDIAIGNLLGSSVYNITLILGVTALVRPIEVSDELIRIDIPLMALVALVCIPVFRTGRRVSRAEGIAFVLAYAVYLGLLIALRT